MVGVGVSGPLLGSAICGGDLGPPGMGLLTSVAFCLKEIVL